MSDDTRKSSEAKTPFPAPENDRNRDEKKKPDTGAPDFDGVPTDPDQVKHDGP
jgi:hypothetical protein